MKKLYELPENQNIKLYIEDKIIIFGHLDGLYSYCWLEEDKNKMVHIKATTEFKKYKDGYKYFRKQRRISMNYQSIVQKDNELWINNKKIEQPKSLFFKNCVSQVNGKTYINGKEFKKGKWKYTLKSIFNTLF